MFLLFASLSVMKSMTILNKKISHEIYNSRR